MIITCSVKSGKRVRLCDDFYMNVYVHPLHSVFLINVLKAVENIVLRLLPEVVGLEIFHNVLIGFPQPFDKLVFVALCPKLPVIARPVRTLVVAIPRLKGTR